MMDISSTLKPIFLELTDGNESSIRLKAVRKESNCIKAATHLDVAPAVLNIPDEMMNLTVQCHKWIMSYDKKVMTPNENDPFLLHRPGSRITLMQSFRVSVCVCLFSSSHIKHIDRYLLLINSLYKLGCCYDDIST